MSIKKPSWKQPAWREWVAQPLYHARHLLQQIHPSPHAGMGAVPTASGVTFRVWAPHAERVFVTGDFNGWSHWQHPLAVEGRGYWSTHVRQARPGDQYKYLIRYRPQRQDGKAQTLLRTDPYARAVTGPHRNGVIWQDAACPKERSPFVVPPRHELVIYELHIGTFAAPAARGIGDFRQAIAKLPYLKWLGINAIELLPVMEFAGDYSWGYNPGHPFAVTETYGGRQALRDLVQASHEYGIAVIMDVVYNHFGPDDLALWQFDGWRENNLGGIYFYNDWRAETPWGHTRPDYGRPEVRQYLRDNALMWVEELGADGLRWDATAWVRNVYGNDGDPGGDLPDGWTLMQWINQEMAAHRPGAIAIAEDMRNNEWITKPVEVGGAGFHAQWDAHFVHTVRGAIVPAQDEVRDLAAVVEALCHRFDGDPFARVIYTESHDEVANGKARVPEEIAPGEADSYFAKKRSTLGAALALTAPGIPMLFQGQELLSGGWFDDHTPLDWSLHERQRGMVRLYRELIHLRRNLGGCSRGLLGPHIHVHHLNLGERLLAFHRWDQGGPGDDVVVVANFANRGYRGYTIGFPRAGLWRVRLNSDDPRYDPAFGEFICPDVVAAGVVGGPAVDGMPCFGNIVIGPYSVLILSQE
ncbi:MAG TPA: alpha-amylase family glycosyl hydrolase [Caldilineaceae bacterium]|nr:alpha-amylase family glycosyl hydrolase [Caldilineaceae bacterium]